MSNAPERILVYPYADGYDGDCHVSTQHHEYEERTQYIRADLVPQWQPIDTAPKDGTYVLVYVVWPDAPDQTVVANWVDHGFTWSWRPIDGLTINYMNATHWMPIPTPPTAPKQEP